MPRMTVNGEAVEAAAEARLLLSDFLRHTLGLTGTHVGCEHGVCGACLHGARRDRRRSCRRTVLPAMRSPCSARARRS